MSNIAILDSSWSPIDEVNRPQKSEQQKQKQGEALIAEKNSSVQTLSNLQKFEKDVLLPTSHCLGKNLLSTDPETGMPSKPQLAAPQSPWSAFQGLGGNQPGLISIIGSVLALQAKTSSNFWSTVWKQASQSMMMAVKFAPIIGTAIQNQYQAESNVTNSQASQATGEGWVNLVGFMGSCVGAIGQEWGSIKDLFTSGSDVEATDESETKLAGGNDDDINVGEDEKQELNDDVNNTNESIKDQAKRTGQQVKSKALCGFKVFTNLLSKVSQTYVMAQGVSAAINDLSIKAPHLSDQAKQQALQGEFQAISQESQKYSDFYSQSFNRLDSMRNDISSNISSAMQILKSAADSITQTVTSMFRG